ncbi:MAG: biotin-dependent carboxyltransferase [Phycisphaerales bacterium]|nr:biotin-dependent carboxyltransferase [Phycisphaerales bacterium]
MLSTVQDNGRPGWSAMGVPVGGAVDRLSLVVGNRLVGNADHTAGIEMTLTGGVFAFDDEASAAITGAESAVSIVGADGVERPGIGWSRLHIAAGESLKIGGMARGARAYLCIGGGIAVEPVMGSASTYLIAGFGGFEGRALRRGDRVPLGEAASAGGIGEHVIAMARSAITQHTLRAVDGAHAAAFNDPSVFWDRLFTVSNRSDRVGVRLEGPKVESPMGGRMTSEGMMWGAIEVPADGSPIVLMADHPTTGGYPVLACIAEIDLPALGQLRPRDVVRFERISVQTARGLLRERRRQLQREAT